ncbi:MAG: bifunctional phosphoribosylaminoimidazolecarboxamide formyltransferase/IMP cyclohydrolase [Planctomycetes bacterium]|nr:bifunctional phosphoribosylaminoimidazolecarboxamide formyltransferase/IMP cyclohydrolase [Planctomycetota bacterium]
MIQRALLSVSDKTGLESFARQLAQLGVELLATGGTLKLLAKAGIPVREVSEHTGFPEMMDGRVKTLHPKIHGGLLALRDEPSHRKAMEQHGIAPIDLVVVNLYPFEQTVAKEGVERSEAIENIDIGGPSMVRSAAKNHRYVTVVTDPADYGRVLDEMQKHGGATSESLRRALAQKAYALTARYDAAISRWLFDEDKKGASEWSFPSSFSLAGALARGLRYGENSHQKAALYLTPEQGPSAAKAEVVGEGKELSYNNFVDLDSALALCLEFDEPFVCVLKHNNPCGAAAAKTIVEALAGAWAGDPLSAFGSVLGFTRPVDLASAEFLVSENRFVEAILAPSFEPDALERLKSGAKWGKNVRLLACGPIGTKQKTFSPLEVKPLRGGFLLQERDLALGGVQKLEPVTKTKATSEQLAALLFANKVCKHVKSNAIVLASGTKVLGVGAGQMSRVDSVKLAVAKAGALAKGSVLASDAFFPFPDGVESAMDAGASAILQPGGSVKDKEVIAACDKRGVPMLFTGTRHFRH